MPSTELPTCPSRPRRNATKVENLFRFRSTGRAWRLTRRPITPFGGGVYLLLSGCGDGEGNPRPHHQLHTRERIFPPRRACRAGAGPREWLWFHLLSTGGETLAAESGLARRQLCG